jgi:hypothetical protein
LHIPYPEQLSDEQWATAFRKVQWLTIFKQKQSNLKSGEKLDI